MLAWDSVTTSHHAGNKCRLSLRESNMFLIFCGAKGDDKKPQDAYRWALDTNARVPAGSVNSSLRVNESSLPRDVGVESVDVCRTKCG